MMYYLKVGGPLMWILFGLSIASTAIIIERVVFFFKEKEVLVKTLNLILLCQFLLTIWEEQLKFA